MSGYECENRNVLRRCLKLASDGDGLSQWMGSWMYIAQVLSTMHSYSVISANIAIIDMSLKHRFFLLYITGSMVYLQPVFSERELMLMFAICRRASVCRLSVCNVRAPYSADWNFIWSNMLVLPRFKESSRSLLHLCDEFFVVSSVLVFTALHTMQTRSSDENSVCPSVCLSVTRVHCVYSL